MQPQTVFSGRPLVSSTREPVQVVDPASFETVADVCIQTNHVYCGDSLPFMRRLPVGSVNLIVTSPEYPGQRANNLSVDEWLAWFRPYAAEMCRILHPVEGILALNVAFKRDGQGWYDTRIFEEVPRLLREAGFAGLADLYLWFWVKPNPVPAGPLELADIAASEPIFVAAKSRHYYFEPVRREYNEKSVGKAVAGKMRAAGVHGGYAGGHDALHPEGARLPNVIFASNSGGPRRPRAEGQSFPPEIPRRFILQYTRPDALIFDPFCGAGTTMKEAQAAFRRWIGIDIKTNEAIKAARWLYTQLI